MLFSGISSFASLMVGERRQEVRRFFWRDNLDLRGGGSGCWEEERDWKNLSIGSLIEFESGPCSSFCSICGFGISSCCFSKSWREERKIGGGSTSTLEEVALVGVLFLLGEVAQQIERGVGDLGYPVPKGWDNEEE